MSSNEDYRPPRLLLWDVDGTLVTGRSIGAEATQRALSEVLGREPVPREVDCAGRTDMSLARDALIANGVNEDKLASVMRRYLRTFATSYREMRNEYAACHTPCPGVRDLLQELSETRAINTLLTGNIAANAVLKIHGVNLQQFFNFEIGGYGGDALDRSDLFPVVMQRVGSHGKDLFDHHEIWIIGDTELDHKVARDHGCRSMLVATGSRSSELLRGLEPDAFFEDLTNTNEVLQTIFA